MQVHGERVLCRQGDVRERILRHRQGAWGRLQPVARNVAGGHADQPRPHVRPARRAGLFGQMPAKRLQRDRAIIAPTRLYAKIHAGVPRRERRVSGPEQGIAALAAEIDLAVVPNILMVHEGAGEHDGKKYAERKILYGKITIRSYLYPGL